MEAKGVAASRFFWALRRAQRMRQDETKGGMGGEQKLLTVVNQWAVLL